MQIIDITTPLTLPPPKKPRSPGLHASNIMKAIAVEVGFLDKKWADDLSLVDAREITDPGSILRIRIGLAWEEHLIPTLEGVSDHPGEILLQGVYMTPDGESVSKVFSGMKDFQLIVHEVKSTYKSARMYGGGTESAEKALRGEWMWITQLKTYCKGMETLYARIYILFICGDYTYPITPMYKEFEVEFTQEEIDTSWDMLIDYSTKKDNRV